MCVVSLTVRPDAVEHYENPPRTFRQLRMRRIKPVSKIGALYPLKNNEFNDIRDREFLDIAYDKAVAFVLINCPQQADSDQQAATVFAALAQACIPFTMVSVQPAKISFVVGECCLPAMCDCLQQLALYPEIVADCTKISVRENSGQPLFTMITALIEILAERNIPVLRMSESYGLIEILTESRFNRQAQQAIEKQFSVK
ncbi:hypothetical protein [Sporomusa aerivorans]|uniref:hypothetical protein n=1 Tax=Sporomusa aerivorans TaxID=204936 RepID=UPI003529F67C